MQNPSSLQVSNIRSSSRELVREFGFMNATLAGTDLSPSAVHAVIEIGGAGGCSAKALTERLLLDKSTVSRLVKSLRDKGLVGDVRSPDDGRRKELRLTKHGVKTASAIARFAKRRVTAAISPLGGHARQRIESGLEAYSRALKASRLGGDGALPQDRARLQTGYSPSLIGAIIQMHAAYYSQLVGFGASFEAQLARGLADFISRLEKPENAIWHARLEDRILGSIVIDGEDLADGVAHLRWFIVGEEIRGAGMGKALLQRALAFCDERQFGETHLWTFKGLDAARSLYESHGFSLAEEYPGDQWGARVIEQKFVRPRP